MKKIIKSILAISLFFCFIGSNMKDINAGGLSASASTGSVSVGGTFSVSVGASGVFVEGLSASCSGCTILSGLGSTINQGETQTMSVRLDSANGASVTVSGTGADYNTETEYPVSASAFVSAYVAPAQTPAAPKVEPKVEPKEDPRSKDFDLSSLSVDSGTLSPDFASDVTSYKVNLPAEATSITVKATPKDSKASVSGTGEIDLKAGDNKIDVICTSEYGTTKTYSIVVYVDEKPFLYTNFNDKKLGVVRNVDLAKAPAGFNQVKVKLDGKEIPAWTNEKIKKTIVYLSDEKGNKSFYLFDNGKVTSTFEFKTVLGKDMFIVDIPKELQNVSGMKYEKIKIDKTELMGWTFKDPSFKDYSIIYVMDMDGKMRYYQYEKQQNTLQIYSNAAPMSQKAYEEKIKNNQMMLVGIGIIAIAAIGYGVFVTIKMRKKEIKE